MASKEEYDVLRLIEHGQTCYISSECVEGWILAGWLKNDPNKAKGELFSLIRDMAVQLCMIHKCRKKPCYQYVNPYSVVITEEKKLYFLDMEAGSNDKLLKFMQKRAVRECFLPAEEAYYQKASKELDIYGIGKTVQYILSVAESEPPLNRREEKRFQKIISKCLKYQSKFAYQSVSEIRRNIPQYRQKARHSLKRAKSTLMIGGASVILMTAWKARDYVPLERKPTKAQISLAAQEDKKLEEAQDDCIEEARAVPDDCRIYMELAAVYIVDAKDYEKSLFYLEKIQNQYAPANDLKEIAEAFIGKRKDPQILEEHLKNLEEAVEAEGKECYYRCLIKGYSFLNTRQSAMAILRLGNLCMEYLDGEEAAEVKEYMASAYEETNEPKQAAHLYEELLAGMTDNEKREEIYKKIISLYEKCGQNDMAMDTCIQGIEEQKDSEDLKIMHIRLLCQDASVGSDLCVQTIQGYVSQTPEILEKEEFKELQREYEIQVEGENVWIGR